MRRYLLVDDNLGLVENIAEIVREEGAAADVAESAPDALELVRRERFDAILTDIQMPRMDGCELVRRVRQVDAGVPVVAFTAYADRTRVDGALQDGVLAVLHKPFPIPMLLTLLDRARRDAFVVLSQSDDLFLEELASTLALQGFTPVAATSVHSVARLGAIHPFVAVVDERLHAVDLLEQALAQRFPHAAIAHGGSRPKSSSASLIVDVLEAVERAWRAHGGRLGCAASTSVVHR